jgi:hypothetical protein
MRRGDWARAARLVPLLVFAALAAACGGKDFHKVYPVKGKVTVNGKPAFECLVYLNRTFNDDHPRRVTPYALTDEKGEFQITSYYTGDGAPEGEYIVTAEWRERSGIMNNNFEGIDRLGGDYAKTDKTRGLPGFVIKVERRALELPPFELKQSAEAKRKHEEWKKRRKAPGLGGGD